MEEYSKKVLVRSIIMMVIMCAIIYIAVTYDMIIIVISIIKNMFERFIFFGPIILGSLNLEYIKSILPHVFFDK